MISHIKIATILLICLLVAGCGDKQSSKPNETTTTTFQAKQVVLVTTPLLGEFVRVIAGDAFNLKVLVGRDVDPSNYKLTPADITEISNANLLIETGAGLEPWFDEYLKSGERAGELVVANVGVTVRKTANGNVDPYVWISPTNARVMLANVRQALTGLLPNLADQFELNERAYNLKIDDAIAYANRAFTPLRAREIVYVGEPLGYYCEEFSLNCQGFLSTEVPMALKQVTLSTPKLLVLGAAVNESAFTLLGMPKTTFISGDIALNLATTAAAGDGQEGFLALQRMLADELTAGLR